jgi:uncharacterized membrane protein
MGYLQHSREVVGMLGVFIILLGVVRGLAGFLRTEWRELRGGTVTAERQSLRMGLGYYLLLGLEILIAADIIDTLLSPSAMELMVLGAVVILRTIISHSLNAELRLTTATLSNHRPAV